ncbi:MAG: hypothetical protein N3G80_04560, partial [Candidatus Micrarchaeota archaeon]|nr:hypothetical protein [Candidatus Micrarchaeota archaeon]
MKKSILFSLALFLLFSQLYATQTTTDPLTNVKSALKNFCKDIKNIVGVVTMLMIVFAAVVYAGGQMMGAETRARANVWATAALVGAIIG